jgi:hypothetical protein
MDSISKPHKHSVNQYLVKTPLIWVEPSKLTIPEIQGLPFGLH